MSSSLDLTGEGKVDYRSLIKEFVSLHPGLYAMYISALLVFPLEALIFPHVFSKAMAKVQNAKAPSMRDLAMVAGLWIGVQCLYLVMHAIDMKLVPLFNEFARSRITTDVIGRFDENFTEPHTGMLLSGILKLPEAARDLFYQVHHAVFADVVLFACTLGYYFWVHPMLGTVFAITLVVWGLITWRFYRTCGAQTYAKENQHNQLHEDIEDVINNLMAVFVYDEADKEILRLAQKGENYNDSLKKSLKCAFKFRILYTIVVVAVFMIMMSIAVKLVLQKRIPQAAFVAVFVVTFTTMGRLMAGFAAFKHIQHELGIVASSSNAVNQSIVLGGNRPGHEHQMPIGDVVLQHVRYKAGDRVVLDDVNAVFEQGRKTAIVGTIGAGKSSVLKIILRLDRPEEGSMLIGGTNAYQISNEAWRKGVAFIPQTPKLMDRTLRENLRYGGSIKDTSKAISVLRSIGLKDIADTFEQRMDEKVGKGGNKLTGGQRQIVWLLRGLLSDANIIVMDEPTSALDYASRDQVIRFIGTALQGRTLIMVTHDQTLLGSVDKVMVMKDGKIFEKPSFGGFSHSIS